VIFKKYFISTVYLLQQAIAKCKAVGNNLRMKKLVNTAIFIKKD
tara:strand:+ start:499 stop:630 length:132 start_codon:yes stop_codon:yes gene_type:complete